MIEYQKKKLIKNCYKRKKLLKSLFFKTALCLNIQFYFEIKEIKQFSIIKYIYMRKENIAVPAEF